MVKRRRRCCGCLGRRGKNSQMGRNTVKDIFLDATDKAVQEALVGLNTTTLVDPERRGLLEDISKNISGHYPEIAKVQGTLIGLVALSEKLEANQQEFRKETEQENHLRAEVKLGIQSREDAVKTAAEELSSVGKRRADQAALVENLKAQLEEASSVLIKLKEDEDQLQKAHSAHESELKKQKDKLQNVGVGQSQKFQQQAAALELEASQLMNSLQKWRSL